MSSADTNVIDVMSFNLRYASAADGANNWNNSTQAPDRRAVALRTLTTRTQYPSDHYPVRATLRFPDPAQPSALQLPTAIRDHAMDGVRDQRLHAPPAIAVASRVTLSCF